MYTIKTAWCFRFRKCIIILFWSFLLLLFFLSAPSRAQESDVWWFRWSWEFHEQNLNFFLTEWRVHIFFHVACFTYIRDDYMYLQCRNFSLHTAIFTKPADFKVERFTFGCVKSQNLAWPREIAKINTRKIVGIPKSQNFVLANNSNNKVDHKTFEKVERTTAGRRQTDTCDVPENSAGGRVGYKSSIQI